MHCQKLENLQEFEALLLGYQNNKEAQQHAARILVGKQGVHGKLPVSIHPNFPAGRGIVRNIPLNVLEKEEDPFQLGIDVKKLSALDDLAKLTLDSLMAPGFQILAARHGKIFYHKSFGHHTFEKAESPVKRCL